MDWLFAKRPPILCLLLPVTESGQAHPRRFGLRAADRLTDPFVILSKK
jgi:hypothetical protein